MKLMQKEKFPVKECRYGKYIELQLEETDPKKALQQADRIAKSILQNDLIEDFELEILK